MHDVVSFLKDAAFKGATAGVGDCYIVDGVMIRANNGILHAGIEWPSETPFALPAEAVDAFLGRVKEVTEILVEDNHVILKAGRLTSKINRRFEEAEPIPDLPTEWKKCPAGLTDALKMAQPFTGEGSGGRVWVTGVRLWQDRVTASSGKAMIDIELPGLAMEKAQLLSEKVVSFLVAQGDPDEYGTDNSSITFRWEDGRWVRCQLIDGEMPEDSVNRIFEEIVGKKAPVKIDDNWKEALADASALSDGTVVVSDSGLRAFNKHSSSSVDMPIKVGADHMSYWHGKDLISVVAIATAWNPAAYPSAAFFKGDGFRGAISGVQK
jgi:hypothetical protein